MGKRPLIILLAVLITFMLLGALPYLSARADDSPPATPIPAPSPTPAPGGGSSKSVGTVVQTIFQNLVFPADTLADELAKTINSPIQGAYDTITAEVGNLGNQVGDILEAPRQGDYEKVAYSGLFTAAALAVPLFLLRLALYQWYKLVGEDDRLTAVIGDWVSAAFLAILCGPFLDWTARLGWWMMGVALGESGTLSSLFVQSITLKSVGFGILSTSIVGGAYLLAFIVAILLSVGGLLLAFFISRAVLFILAALGPAVFVCGVVPQLRWLRGLWLKGLTIIALLPLIAAGAFKVTAAVNIMVVGDGILSDVIHIAWMLGMVGALMSVVGILGRITIGATVDAAKQVVGAVKGVVDLAGAAAMGVATGGAGLAAVPAVEGGGKAAAGMTAEKMSVAGLTADGQLASAGSAVQQSGLFRALGMDKTAGLLQNQGQGQQINARRLELKDRMDALENKGKGKDRGNAGENHDLGFPLQNSDQVSQVLKDYGGPRDKFIAAERSMEKEFDKKELDPAQWSTQHWNNGIGTLAKEWEARKDGESFDDVVERSGVDLKW